MYPGKVFKAFIEAWRQDAASERVDILAAELAALALAKPDAPLALAKPDAPCASEGSSTYLGFVDASSVTSLYFLEKCGVDVRVRQRACGRSLAFIEAL